MIKNWSWSIPGFTVDKMTHSEIIHLCQECNIAGLEGAPPLFEEMSLQDLRITGKKYRSSGVQIHTFHFPYQQENDLASFYETPRRKAVAIAKKWLERAFALESKIVIVHPTTTYFDSRVEGLDRYLERLIRSLEEILPKAEELGIRIALENILPWSGGRFGSEPEHLLPIFSYFSSTNLGFCLDTGHALVTKHDEADVFLGELSKYLIAFHLDDNAGDRGIHLAPGYGLVNWDQIFQTMARIGFSGIACIETPPFAHGPNYSLSSWKKMIEETDLLVEKALKTN